MRSACSVVSASLGLLALLALASTARANCAPPPPAVLWTYPQNGAEDVPIDATLWLVLQGRPSTVTLNGRTVEPMRAAGGAYSIEPGMLDASQEYVLEIGIDDHDQDASAPSFELRFRTTSERSPMPPRAEITGHHKGEGYSDHACADVIETQDCFDTGQSTLVTLEAEGDDAIAWLVSADDTWSRAVWPNRCGSPAIFGDRVECYDVSAIGPGGRVGPATRYCPNTLGARPEPDASEVDGACRAGQPTSSPIAWWLTLAAIGLMRRRGVR